MTADLPRVGQVTEAKAETDDDILWSVTKILKVLDKSDQLIRWACGVQAELTVDNMATIYGRLKREGRESAIEYVEGLRWHTDGLLSDSALGTIAHHLFNEYALTGARPEVHPELHPDHKREQSTLDRRDVHSLERMLDQFAAFLDEYQPDYLATESVVYNVTYRYAGQADAWLRIQNTPYLVDYKTSRKSWTKANKERGPYPEASLQATAYINAERAAIFRARRYHSYGSRYYLLSPSEREMAVPVPKVDGGLAVYVTPDLYGVYPLKTGPDQFEAFLFCLEMARWHFNVAKHAVGNKMTPPFPRQPSGDDPFAGLPKE